MIRFAFINDLHYGQAGTSYSTEIPALITQLNALNLDFVITGGDQTHNSLSAEAEGIVNQLNQLNVPWYWAYGNHDVGDDGLNTKLDEMGINRTTPRVVNKDGFNIVIFHTSQNSQSVGRIETSDLTWYQNTFDGDDTPNIVVSHHPTFIEPGREVYALANKDDFISTLETYGNAKLVLSGHDHAVRYAVEQNDIIYQCGQRSGGSTGYTKGYNIIAIDDEFNIFCYQYNYGQTVTPSDIVAGSAAKFNGTITTN